MNKAIKYFLVFFLFMSCINNSSKNRHKNDFSNVKRVSDDGGFSYSFFTKDSVLIKKDKILGFIKYVGVFDTITTKLRNKNSDFRYITYKYHITSEVPTFSVNDFEFNENNKQGKFGALTNNEIPFEIDVLNRDSGIYYLDGIIEDKVYMKVENDTMLRLLSNNIRASYKFEVK
ncbi:hypothetical protein ACXGQW_02045 [Wenyingzhuangia sp. IMCC45533]